ncbi:MAG: hypothetical protein H6707_04005 [Deltaproteobacteria bacterium]|nr:hypothetical protein [Deltaproteobacteria bacterium]
MPRYRCALLAMIAYGQLSSGAGCSASSGAGADSRSRAASDAVSTETMPQSDLDRPRDANTASDAAQPIDAASAVDAKRAPDLASNTKPDADTTPVIFPDLSTRPPDAGVVGCQAQDCRSFGPCISQPSGHKWDGQACKAMEAGCTAVGKDCGSIARGPFVDRASCNRAFKRCGACAAQIATVPVIGTCSQPVPGAKWDGSSCVTMGVGCRCVGPSCKSGGAAPFSSVQQCKLAMAGCP